MTPEEAKTAFVDEIIVRHDEIVYDRISALIYRKDEEGNIKLSLELLDEDAHSVTIAQPDKVESAYQKYGREKHD